MERRDIICSKILAGLDEPAPLPCATTATQYPLRHSPNSSTYKTSPAVTEQLSLLFKQEVYPSEPVNKLGRYKSVNNLSRHLVTVHDARELERKAI
jgi:hypothetical protein